MTDCAVNSFSHVQVHFFSNNLVIFRLVEHIFILGMSSKDGLFYVGIFCIILPRYIAVKHLAL